MKEKILLAVAVVVAALTVAPSTVYAAEESACEKMLTEQDSQLKVEWMKLCEADKVLAAYRNVVEILKEHNNSLKRAVEALEQNLDLKRR